MSADIPKEIRDMVKEQVENKGIKRMSFTNEAAAYYESAIEELENTFVSNIFAIVTTAVMLSYPEGKELPEDLPERLAADFTDSSMHAIGHTTEKLRMGLSGAVEMISADLKGEEIPAIKTMSALLKDKATRESLSKMVDIEELEKMLNKMKEERKQGKNDIVAAARKMAKRVHEARLFDDKLMDEMINDLKKKLGSGENVLDITKIREISDIPLKCEICNKDLPSGMECAIEHLSETGHTKFSPATEKDKERMKERVNKESA